MCSWYSGGPDPGPGRCPQSRASRRSSGRSISGCARLTATEQTNLADSEPARVAALQELLDRHFEDARPPLYPFTTEAPTPVDKTSAEPFVPGDEYVYWPN